MATPTVKVGDKLPEGTLNYVPWTPELESHVSSAISILTALKLVDIFRRALVVFVRGPEIFLSKFAKGHIIATKINTEKDWKGKKVVLFSVPGAFTVSLSAYLSALPRKLR